MNPSPYQRGEVYWVNLDPTIGSETKKTRPGVIVSNNAQNRAGQRVIVVPMTSVVNKIYPFEILVSINHKQSKIMVDQIRTVDCIRLKSKIAKLASEEIEKLDRVLKLILSLG